MAKMMPERARQTDPSDSQKKGPRPLFGRLVTIQTSNHNAFSNTWRRQFNPKQSNMSELLSVCAYVWLNTMSPTAEPGCQDTDAEV